MLSRKIILLVALALFFQPHPLLAKKEKPAQVKSLGAHTLAREEWPPSIAPDFVRILDKGYALLSDQGGRLAIVDLKREQGPQVLGEVSGLGKKIIDLASSQQQHRIYALTAQETDNDTQYSVAIINSALAHDPQIAQRMAIPFFSEPTALAASADILAVGGTGSNGKNQVVLFNSSMKNKRSDEGNEPMATLNVEQPVAALDLQERQLLVLEPTPGLTLIDVYSLVNPRAPQKICTIKMDGNYTKLARSKDALAVLGQGADRKLDVRLIAMRPSPHAVARQRLPLSEALDLVAQKNQLLVLGNQGSRLAVLPISIGKTMALELGQPIVLPAGAQAVASKARIAANDKEAYIASDSGTLQVLTVRNDSWTYTYSHTIPRLPVALVAFGGNQAVLAGSDIKVYDVSLPERPLLTGTAEPGGAVRSIAIAGNLLLALTRDQLSLRRLDKPSDVVASIKVDGQRLAYDAQAHKAYVLSAREKETVVTPVAVSGTLTAEPARTLPAAYSDASASNGRLLVSGLSNLALYDMTAEPQLLGQRVFPNLAIRDMALAADTAVITALDAASRGFLLTINTGRDDLPTIGSVDLPQDAVAIAVNGSQAVVVGRGADGKDAASIVDLSNSAAPKLISTFRVLEAASAVAIRGKLGLVGGRGMQILNL